MLDLKVHFTPKAHSNIPIWHIVVFYLDRGNEVSSRGTCILMTPDSDIIIRCLFRQKRKTQPAAVTIVVS